MVSIGNSWDSLLKDQFSSDYYLKLREFLKSEYSQYHVYPEMHNIFNAMKYTDYNDVKAVILGQDPYHNPGQAHGLCFSVKRPTPPPPSLLNIYKEQKADLGITQPTDFGELTAWANQGVMMLNTVLTVREGEANSHKNHGWETLTDRIITLLNEREKPIVFLLWGSPARSKKVLITNKRHLILECAHPSPLSASRGFFGCRHFSKTNDFLSANGETPIDWQLTE